MGLEVVESLNKNEKCIFCRRNEVDELRYGKIYKIGDIVTHYFCMLFSSNMEQNGEDDEGILGFLPKDIKKEVFRGNKLTCNHCTHPGATIGCAIKSCKKKFHYPCGLQHGSLHLFFGQFRSYCSAHRQPQHIPQTAIKLSGKSICVMCQDEIPAIPTLTTIWAPCCKTAWLHRTCVQRMAVNAGYFFKCPNCNNKEVFRKEMLECGIYIPDQDAAWELEPNAYNELTERYNSCDAASCSCPNGRNFSEQGCDWEVILCSLCGSQGIHNKCGEDFFDSKGQWTCSFCSSITTTTTTPVVQDPGPSEISQKQRNTHHSQNLRKDPCPSNRLQKHRRKRNLSPDSSDENTPSKVGTVELPCNDENDTLHLLDSSGEQIKVVRLENDSVSGIEIGGVQVDDNIVQIDSDDDEKAEEKQPKNLELTNKPKVAPDTAPSIIIDLLDDSDDEETETTTKCSNYTPSTISNRNHCTNSEEENDDDVIFVSCDPPEPNPVKDNSTAMIRIIDNDREYIVTPMDIRRNANHDLTSNPTNTAVTASSVNPVRGSFRVLPDERPMGNYIWQSVPLHKSNDNSFPQPQIISTISLDSSFRSNNNDGSNYISKENESNSWIPTQSSEIIDID